MQWTQKSKPPRRSGFVIPTGNVKLQDHALV